MNTPTTAMQVPAAFAVTDDEVGATLWTGFLSRRQVAIMAVVAVVEIAITVGLMHMAAQRSAELQAAQQRTTPEAGTAREGLRGHVPAWAQPQPPSAS